MVINLVKNEEYGSEGIRAISDACPLFNKYVIYKNGKIDEDSYPSCQGMSGSSVCIHFQGIRGNFTICEGETK